MTNSELILKMAHKNNGMVTSAQVTSAGIPREYLRELVEKKVLDRSGRGVYIVPTAFEDEMFNLQMRFKRGIFSHETALFIMDLTDHTPEKYSMTFPLGYNTSALHSENVRYFRVKDELYEIGIIPAKSPGGNPIRIYNAERTLCDILKGRSNTDIQIVSDAFKRYTRFKKMDIPLLSKYGKLFHVEKKLSLYLEVLL
jgi:predicted transcriptional regulator of viral defense system